MHRLRSRVQLRFRRNSHHITKSARPRSGIRIGIHAGEPVEESNDLFGSAVQIAARICDIAQADAILVSREVMDACAGVDLRFAPAGSETLKGFSEPVQLFSPAH